MSMKEQIQAFQDASVIIGASGAGSVQAYSIQINVDRRILNDWDPIEKITSEEGSN